MVIWELTNLPSALLQPTCCAVVRVSTVYTKSDGFAYDVQFGRLMGDVPLLRVTNTSGLMGSGANVSVTLVQQGSPNIFLGPIPAQLLSQPVTHPDAISLAVNNVVATCRASAGCRFSHSAAATPTITAVTPSSVSTSSGPAQVGQGVQVRGMEHHGLTGHTCTLPCLLPQLVLGSPVLDHATNMLPLTCVCYPSGCGLQITITGTGFSTTAAGNSISLGDAACSSVVVVATSSDGASATQLRCTVPSGVAAGRRQVFQALLVRSVGADQTTCCHICRIAPETWSVVRMHTHACLDKCREHATLLHLYLCR